MDWYALVCRHLVAPLWAAREKSPYLRHYRHLKEAQYWPPEKTRASQLERFRRLAQHAAANTAYYGRTWREIGFSPQDIRSLDDLAGLPLLTKDDIRSCCGEMVAGNVPKARLIPKKTSGSTGVSLEFFVDEDSLQWKRGSTLVHDEWSGWRLGEKIAAVWGNPTNRVNWRARARNLLLERYDYLDTLRMGEADMLAFYRRQCARRPTLLFGHAHSLYLFALFLKARGLEPFRVKGIISTCMVLHAHERRAIEAVFGRPVTNRYGCEEVSLIGCECGGGEGLHLNEDTLIVEFLRDGKPAGAGTPGSIVVTDLTNYGMPFIRYRVGDVGVPSARRCSCGRTHSLMESVEGRVADYVVTPDGHYVSGISLTENFAMLLPEVKQMQIVQEATDFLVFRIVKGEGYVPASEGKIAQLVSQRFGERMRHRIDSVDRIEPEASGKYRFCISRLGSPFS